VFVFVREEAVARGEDVTPGHWLLALLRDAEDPVDVDGSVASGGAEAC
jgi:hypothetical protein